MNTVLKSFKDINIESMENLSEMTKIKPFNQIKSGDVLVIDNKEKAEVVATGTLKSLLKYDNSGATADALESGDLSNNEKAVAVKLGPKETAVYPYEDLSAIFKGMESMEKEITKEEELEEAKKTKVESEHEDEKEKMESDCEDEKMEEMDDEEEIKESKKSKTESEDEEEEEVDEEEDEEESIEESKKSKTESEDEEEEEVDEEEDEEDSVTEAKCKKESEDEEEEVDEEEDEEEMEEKKESVDHSESISGKVLEQLSTEEAEQSDLNVEESLSKLVDGDSTLSEEFRSKAAIIFEAAVSEKVADKVESIREGFESTIREQVEQRFESVVEKVDNYLTYAIESWIQDNSETVDAKLRTEITESFISSLKNVFEKHYIEMPEGKLNLYDDLSTKATEMEEKLAEQTEKLEEAAKELTQLKREKIIREASEGLYDTQASRLNKLTENLEFVDEESFAKKVSIVKETYFKDNGKSEDETLNESSNSEVRTRIVEEEDSNIDKNSVMGKYVEAIARHAKSK